MRKAPFYPPKEHLPADDASTGQASEQRKEWFLTRRRVFAIKRQPDVRINVLTDAYALRKAGMRYITKPLKLTVTGRYSFEVILKIGLYNRYRYHSGLFPCLAANWKAPAYSPIRNLGGYAKRRPT